MPANPLAPRPPKATIDDVARAANVSVATVSRALRGLPNVAPSTRARVEEIARDLNYRADPAASRLAAGVSRSIGVAVPVLNSWYVSNVIAGVETACNSAGYDIVVIGLTTPELRRRLVYNTDSIHSRIDGLIMVDAGMSHDELALIVAHGLPTVMIGQHSPLCSSVGINDREVGALAAAHLYELGHERIGLITGLDPHPAEMTVPGQRQHGFDQVVFDLNKTMDPSWYQPSDFSVKGGYRAAQELMTRPNAPTAIFALSDEMAFGVLHWARDAGLAVPGDLSVIGVDDHDLAEVMGLTTIAQDVPEHGARAARLVLDHLALIDQTRHEVFHTIALIERSTTGPPTAG